MPTVPVTADRVSLQAPRSRLYVPRTIFRVDKGWSDPMNASLRRFRLFSVLVPAALTACAGGSALRLQDVTPESVGPLQAQHAQQPGDQATATRLGVAYFRAGQFPQARAVLDTVVE